MTVTRTAAVLALGSLLALGTVAEAQTAAPDPATAGAGATAATSGAGAAAAASGNSAPAPAAAPAAAAAPSAAATAAAGPVLPNGMDITPDHMEHGRWYNAEGIPTFKIEDGKLDYASFSGYRRYHAECHVCHGPDGEGSTYAPALKDSVVNKIDYYEFQQIVASGKQNVGTGQANQVMPAFGTNRNVWCYVDDIYAYLLAHGTGAIPRGRPANRADKSDDFAKQEDSCMSG